MKVSREQAAENRERVLRTAAALFREHGFDGIGLADLMKEAGLTHGGFYGHFTSKDDLIAKSCEEALQNSLKDWDKLLERNREEAFTIAVRSYLSVKHRDMPGRGCLVAALGADSPRQCPTVRRVMASAVCVLIGRMEQFLPARIRARRRQKAIHTFASMVGAIVLARAAGEAAVAEEILQAVTEEILHC